MGTGAGCAMRCCGAPGEPAVASRVAGETPAEKTCSPAGDAATRALGSAYEPRRLVSAEGDGAGARGGGACASSWPGLAATLALVCEPGSNDDIDERLLPKFRVQMR